MIPAAGKVGYRNVGSVVPEYCSRGCLVRASTMAASRPVAVVTDYLHVHANRVALLASLDVASAVLGGFTFADDMHVRGVLRVHDQWSDNRSAATTEDGTETVLCLPYSTYHVPPACEHPVLLRLPDRDDGTDDAPWKFTVVVAPLGQLKLSLPRGRAVWSAGSYSTLGDMLPDDGAFVVCPPAGVWFRVEVETRTHQPAAAGGEPRRMLFTLRGNRI